MEWKCLRKSLLYATRFDVLIVNIGEFFHAKLYFEVNYKTTGAYFNCLSFFLGVFRLFALCRLCVCVRAPGFDMVVV